MFLSFCFFFFFFFLIFVLLIALHVALPVAVAVVVLVRLALLARMSFPDPLPPVAIAGIDRAIVVSFAVSGFVSKRRQHVPVGVPDDVWMRRVFRDSGTWTTTLVCALSAGLHPPQSEISCDT